MKKTAGTGFVLILCIAVFISSMTGYVAGVRANRKEEYSHINTKKSVMPFQTAVEKGNDNVLVKNGETTCKYVLKNDKDGVSLFCVYSDGSEKLYQSYDISVNSLPAADREMLKNGIEMSSLSGALQTVEDFLS